jgi:hypothetical protein
LIQRNRFQDAVINASKRKAFFEEKLYEGAAAVP